MVINGHSLLLARPIHDMTAEKLYESGVSSGLGEVGYDIRIQQEIRFTRDSLFRRCVLVHEIGRVSQLTRSRGRFALASSLEEFNVPPWLMGIVHDKSSWARRGLSVFNTVIESGWKGHLTLELVYHGWGTLHIPAGAGIAQVVFHQVSNPAQYVGRYQNQPSRPVAAITAKASA